MGGNITVRARIWDIWRRAETGPICPVRTFETKEYWPRLKELIKEYDIKYDPECLVPTDDTLIDDVYKAGMNLLLDVGVICTDTDRIIKFEENEIEEMLRNKPEEITLGEGKDAITVRPRKLEDKALPKIQARILGGISAEEMVVKLFQSFAMEPLVDILNPQPVPPTLEGLPLKVGSPFEMHAEICNVGFARTALRRAGRPGMPLFGTSSATDTPVIAACSPEYGWRRCDALPTIMLPQMKINYVQLRKAMCYHQYGCLSIGYGAGYIGGLSGGPEGSVITSVAESIASYLLYQNDLIDVSIDSVKYRSIDRPIRMLIWGANLANAAFYTNTNLAGGTDPSFTNAGPCTEMALLEWAAEGIGRVVTGQAILGGGTGRLSAYADYFAPLEARFLGEVCRAAAGMKLEDANEMVKEVLAKYEEKVKNPPIGKKFQECYDLATLTPSKEYLELYRKTKKELEDMGLKFEY
jgi:methylamine--corrinoid protein Co-methyltransferase